MKSVSYTMVYDGATVEDVYAMLGEQSFRERVCDAQGVVSHDVSVQSQGSGMRVRIEQVQDTKGVPSFAKKIVGDKTTVIQEERWTSSDAATVELTIPGKPGEIKGTVSIVADGSAARETVELNIKVGIPLVGGKIEGLLGDLLLSALRAEERVGKTWLA